MQFFHTLLIASFCIFSTVFANVLAVGEVKMGEIKILAKVNQGVVTNYDISNRIEFLQILTPEMKKATKEEKQYYAMQSLVQDELRTEYAKKINFKLNKEQKIHNRSVIIANMRKKNVPKSAIEKNESFIESEVLWQAVIDTVIRPKIQISPEMVRSIAEKNKKLSNAQIESIAIEQQIQVQSAQIIEAMRKISIIEFTQDQ